jgi:hypothetical protein
VVAAGAVSRDAPFVLITLVQPVIWLLATPDWSFILPRAPW